MFVFTTTWTQMLSVVKSWYIVTYVQPISKHELLFTNIGPMMQSGKLFRLSRCVGYQMSIEHNKKAKHFAEIYSNAKVENHKNNKVLKV